MPRKRKPPAKKPGNRKPSRTKQGKRENTPRRLLASPAATDAYLTKLQNLQKNTGGWLPVNQFHPLERVLQEAKDLLPAATPRRKQFLQNTIRRLETIYRKARAEMRLDDK